MIDRFTKIANALQFLRLPSVVIGLVSLVTMIAIIVSPKSLEGDLYLIPSAVGILWSVTTYSFLVNFHAVPQKADRSWTFFKRVRRMITRVWYWFMGMVFIGTTVGAIFVSYRMITIWLKDYVG